MDGGLDGNIAEDPSVIFRGDGDYRLSPESQCFEAGIGARVRGRVGEDDYSRFQSMVPSAATAPRHKPPIAVQANTCLVGRSASKKNFITEAV